jgi:hypothetical protein
MSIPKNVLQYSYALSNLSSATFYDFARAPMELKFQDSQVVTNSNRTVGKGAYLSKELLATKVKLQCRWSYLTPDELQSILSVFRDKNWVSLRYNDPNNNTYFISTTFYCGDNDYEVASFDTSTGKFTGYKSLTWNFVER